MIYLGKNRNFQVLEARSEIGLYLRFGSNLGLEFQILNVNFEISV